MDVGASMTEWEREREKAEFFRAAALYRPMSGLMAARFTRETDATEPSSSSTVEVSVDSGVIFSADNSRLFFLAIFSNYDVVSGH